jgi:hypothetical protein
MKYMILIHGNPRSREAWLSFTDGEQAAGLEAYSALTEELVASGEMVVSEALADPSAGVRLPARENSLVRTDGPFAETKEHLAGFYLVECDGRQRAIEIAGRIPEAEFGLVEVRPVLTLSGPDV